MYAYDLRFAGMLTQYKSKYVYMYSWKLRLAQINKKKKNKQRASEILSVLFNLSDITGLSE